MVALAILFFKSSWQKTWVGRAWLIRLSEQHFLWKKHISQHFKRHCELQFFERGLDECDPKMWSAFEFATKSCIFGLVSNPMAFTAGDCKGDALHHVPSECRSERAANGSSWLLPNAVARSATCILEAFWGREKNRHSPKKKGEIQSSKIQNPKSTFQTLELLAVLHFSSCHSWTVCW